MIDVILRREPGDTGFKMELPASRYDEIEAKAALGADSFNEVYIEYNTTSGVGTARDFPNVARTLARVARSANHWNELNFLAYRLRDMTSMETFKLNGALPGLRQPDMAAVINMTYAADGFKFAGHIRDAYDVGRYLAESGRIEAPAELRPFLDYGKIGTEWLKRDGTNLENSFFFEFDPAEFPKVYDGVTLPEAPREDTVFHVLLLAPDAYGDTIPTDLELPATEAEIADALERADVDTPGTERKTVEDCAVAALKNLYYGDVSLEKLNELAGRISGMSNGEYRAFLTESRLREIVPVSDDWRLPDAADTVEQLLACADKLDHDVVLEPTMGVF
ncbi:MAG: hypothetical protein LBT12_07040 [Oscillospiraceae bacterium]|jgi:hypothetical protein|nr:hypothetical protein [Oscillospiraceae bacterium]